MLPIPSHLFYNDYIMKYFETGSLDPTYNLAFEEYILRHHTEGEILMLWQNDNAIIIGLNQNTEAEINRGFVDQHHISVVRRITGGGAVYHDLGNLNYSFITDIDKAEQVVISKFAEPIVKALLSLGLDAEASGRNDILVSGRKVSGTAQRILNGRILFHGTLLFDSNADVVANALNVDADKFKGKASRSVKSRIGDIRDFLREDMTLPEFKDYIIRFLVGDSNQNAIPLSASEIAEIENLRDEKYSTWEWNYGTSPKFTYSNKRRFDGGSLEARVDVEKGGLIKDIVFYGDFLATTDMAEITNSLKGLPFRRDPIIDTLSQFRIQNYFGGITTEDIAALLFK